MITTKSIRGLESDRKKKERVPEPEPKPEPRYEKIKNQNVPKFICNGTINAGLIFNNKIYVFESLDDVGCMFMVLEIRQCKTS